MQTQIQRQLQIRVPTQMHINLQCKCNAGADADAEKKVKSAGQLKTQGKNYEVQSGDILHFKLAAKNMQSNKLAHHQNG